MQQSFVVFIVTVSCVIALQPQLDYTPRPSGDIEDIMSIVILDAGTSDERESIAADVKVMIGDITELAKGAAAVLKRNTDLLNKAANLIETAKDMLGEGEDLGAMELMQTILLAKIQEMIVDKEDKSIEETNPGKKAELKAVDSSGDTNSNNPLMMTR